MASGNLLQGNTEALKEILRKMGIPYIRFELQGTHNPCSNHKIHPPHQEDERSFCLGKPGHDGERALYVVVEERKIYPPPGVAKGIFFYFYFPGSLASGS